MKLSLTCALSSLLLISPNSAIAVGNSNTTQHAPAHLSTIASQTGDLSNNSTESLRLTLPNGAIVSIVLSTNDYGISATLVPENEIARNELNKKQNKISNPLFVSRQSYPNYPNPYQPQTKEKIGETSEDFIGREAMKSLKTKASHEVIYGGVIGLLAKVFTGNLPYIISITLTYFIVSYLEEKNDEIDKIIEDKTNRGIRVTTHIYKDTWTPTFELTHEPIKCPLINPPNLYSKCQVD